MSIGARERVAYPAKLGPLVCSYIFPAHHLLHLPVLEASFPLRGRRAHTLGSVLARAFASMAETCIVCLGDLRTSIPESPPPGSPEIAATDADQGEPKKLTKVNSKRYTT